MSDKMRMLSTWILLIYQVILHGGECLRQPDFRSAWLPIQAQGGPASLIDVQHSLGVIPDLIEVLVKVVDGDNKDFIFKAMGTSSKDDDYDHAYGKVVFFYNSHLVRVMAPDSFDDFATGGAVYTGESPYWKGVNSQFSNNASIQVRCWLGSSLPPPCYSSSGTIIKSGSTAGGDSYIELHHTLGLTPDIMMVRAKMTNGNLDGWYCNGQGSVTGQFSISGNYAYQVSSGIIFGYDNNAVRIWASSHGVDSLCETFDGWEIGMSASEGLVDVVAWCDLGIAEITEMSVDLTVNTNTADLEIQLPQPFTDVNNVLFSLMVRIKNGPNAGYLFEGIGSASSNVYNINTGPCDYGGVIYAYSDSAIRMWIPADGQNGATVCISQGYGLNTNTEGAIDVTVIIKAREWEGLQIASEDLTIPETFPCGTYYRVGTNLSYTGSLLREQVSFSTGDCWRNCHTDHVCSTFALEGASCKTYESFDESLLVTKSGSEVWTIEK